MFNILGRRTLFRDLILVLISITIIAVTGLGLVLTYISTVKEERNINKSADALTKEFSKAVALPLMNLDRDTVGQIAEAYLSSVFLMGVKISIDDSTFWEKTRRSGKNLIDRQTPVLVSQRKVGNVELLFSRDSVRDVQRSTIQTLVATLLLVLMVVVPALYFLIQSLVHKPLNYLIHGIRFISSGSYGERLQQVPQSDVNEIISEVNLMAENIKERSRQLSESENKYRGIFENATDGIFQSTPGGNLFSANHAMAGIFGFSSPEELISEFEGGMGNAYVNKDDRKSVEGVLSEGGHVFGFETKMYRKDGQVIWVKINSKPVFHDDGSLLYIEGFVENITERKEMQQALHQATKELETQVDLRTRSLTEKTDKMERMNRLFVDRELTMKKLKAENRRLKEQLT